MLPPCLPPYLCACADASAGERGRRDCGYSTAGSSSCRAGSQCCQGQPCAAPQSSAGVRRTHQFCADGVESPPGGSVCCSRCTAQWRRHKPPAAVALLAGVHSPHPKVSGARVWRCLAVARSGHDCVCPFFHTRGRPCSTHACCAGVLGARRAAQPDHAHRAAAGGLAQGRLGASGAAAVFAEPLGQRTAVVPAGQGSGMLASSAYIA